MSCFVDAFLGVLLLFFKYLDVQKNSQKFKESQSYFCAEWY